MASFQHRAMFRHERPRALLQPKRRAFLDPYLGPFGAAPEGGEGCDIRSKIHAVIAPMTGGDHPSVKIENLLKLDPVKGRKGLPVPRVRKRRDDAQALLLRGLGAALCLVRSALISVSNSQSRAST